MSENYLWTFFNVVWQFFFKGDYEYKKHCSGSKRSIIRKIGSALPLPPTSRTCYINSNSLNEVYAAEYLTDDGIDCISDSDTSDSNDTSYARMSEIHNLQEELKKLKLQVASILENQKHISKNELKEEKSCEKDVAPPPPPPLPPPPPPLLPNLLTPLCTPLKLGPRNTVPRYKEPTAVDALSDVLKELASAKRPKLRPILRSPGGRPIKPKPLVEDPSDVLTEVLKRRFSMMHLSDANESDTSIMTDVLSP